MTGIGIDIIDSKRFRAKKYTRKNKTLTQMFTQNELDYCFARRDPASHLATHFAAKEAAWKALSDTKKFNIPLFIFLQEVEIIHDERGNPGIVFHSGGLKKHRAFVSIADSDTHAIAVVVLQK